METKEHFEILLEHMDSKFDLVLESHAGLNKKIEDLRQEVREFRQENEFEHREICQELKKIRKQSEVQQKTTAGLTRRVSHLEAARI